MDPVTHYGSNDSGGNSLQGIIKKVSLKDLDTPSNTITHTLNSGPPEYEVGSEYVIADADDLQTGWINNGDETYTCNGSQTGITRLSWTGLVPEGEAQVCSLHIDSLSAGSIKMSMFGKVTSEKFITGTIEELLAPGSTDNSLRVEADVDFIGTVSLVSSKPYISTISDGTIYEPSEEFGTEPDIMRADDWGTPNDPEITTSGRTAIFNGLQATFTSALTNAPYPTAGLHFTTFKVHGDTSGDQVRVRVGESDAAYVVGNGIYTQGTIADGVNAIRVQCADGGFNGSVEILSIEPVPQGVTYENVVAEDWSQP